MVCQAGQCLSPCLAGQQLCGNSCSDPLLDPKNCGGCGKVCKAQQACVAGTCQ